MPFDAETEPLRIRFLEEIRPVAGDISQDRLPARTAGERTKELYDFMTGLGMEEKMSEARHNDVWCLHDLGVNYQQPHFNAFYAKSIRNKEAYGYNQ